MNETLKQRIVGAAVITAIAAIFIPMLFDSPIPNADLQTSELSLPHEPTNDRQKILDNLPKTRHEILTQSRLEKVNLQSKKINKASKEANLKSWIIQVGSFSQKKNAIEFRDRLRKNDFTAYVDSVTTSNHGTLYRLRVGPELNEKRVLNTKIRLESRYKIKTLLVSE